LKTCLKTDTPETAIRKHRCKQGNSLLQ